MEGAAVVDDDEAAAAADDDDGCLIGNANKDEDKSNPYEAVVVVVAAIELSRDDTFDRIGFTLTRTPGRRDGGRWPTKIDEVMVGCGCCCCCCVNNFEVVIGARELSNVRVLIELLAKCAEGLATSTGEAETAEAHSNDNDDDDGP